MLCERLDLPGEAAERKGLEDGLPPLHRRCDVRVGVDGARELDRDAEALAARRDDPGAHVALLLGPYLIHDQQRRKRLRAVLEGLCGRRIDRAHQRDELPAECSRRARPFSRSRRIAAATSGRRAASRSER